MIAALPASARAWWAEALRRSTRARRCRRVARGGAPPWEARVGGAPARQILFATRTGEVPVVAPAIQSVVHPAWVFLRQGLVIPAVRFLRSLRSAIAAANDRRSSSSGSGELPS